MSRTINYKEKYEKALERAINHRNHDGLTLEQYHTIDIIFPELAASESERIMETLIEFFKNYKTQEDIGIKTFFGIPTDDIIAWLEKKGSEPNWCHHKVDLSNCSEEYRKAYYDGWNNCNMQHSQCAWSKEDEKVYQSIIDDTIQENQLDNEQINWFISLKKRIGG